MKLSWAIVGAISTALLTGPQGAHGDDLSLDDIIAATVASSPDLQSASYDKEAAEASALSARGIREWQLRASVIGQRQQFRLFGVDDQNSLTVEGGVSKLLPTGGTVSVGTSGTYTDKPAGLNTKYITSFALSVSQPLLRGRGRLASQGSIDRADLAVDASHYARVTTASELIKNIIVAYWELAYAKRDVAVRQESIKIAAERLRTTNILLDAGKVAPTEPLAARQILAQRQADLAASQQRLVERSLALHRLMGSDLATTGALINPTSKASSGTILVEFDAALQKAYETNPALQWEKANKKIAEKDLQIAQTQDQDALDLEFSAGPTGFADTFGEVLKNMATLDGLQISLGLTYQRSIGTRARRGNLEVTQAQVAKSQTAVRARRSRVASELHSALALAELAHANLKASDEILKVADANVDAVKIQFEQGKATSFDVQERQIDRQNALLMQARAYTDIQIAITRYDAAVGLLLDKHGIKFSKSSE